MPGPTVGSLVRPKDEVVALRAAYILVGIWKPPSFRSFLLHPGQKVTYTFARPGTYNYDCNLHPNNMKGTVVVTGG